MDERPSQSSPRADPTPAGGHGDGWDPHQYERFREERSRPFHDLTQLIQGRAGMRVVDLGCGNGELTRALHRLLRAGETLGIDNSPAMLARAGAFTNGGLRFELADLAKVALASNHDLVFSNAALQWLGDHPGLFARLTAALAPGGQLAVQVPANYDQPAHLEAAAVAAEPTFAAALAGQSHPVHVLPPEQYAELLERLGYAEQHVRLQVYAHHLAGREDVLEWLKGSLLSYYRARLAPALYTEFEARYRARLLASLPDTRPFFFPFKRILLWARRPRG
jgi:trans-aconitate 2-methyltransferase